MKNLPLSSLKKKAWNGFSKYIRQRDKGVCFTCGIKKDYKLQDAGHFYHGKKYPVLYFEEKNVHCQCPRCNRFLNGARDVYAKNLVAKYGPGVLDELYSLRQIIKVGRDFYEGIIFWNEHNEKI